MRAAEAGVPREYLGPGLIGVPRDYPPLKGFEVEVPKEHLPLEAFEVEGLKVGQWGETPGAVTEEIGLL